MILTVGTLEVSKEERGGTNRRLMTLREWQDRLHKIRVEAGRKGGLAKVKKGFAKMPKWKRRLATFEGNATKRRNRQKENNGNE